LNYNAKFSTILSYRHEKEAYLLPQVGPIVQWRGITRRGEFTVPLDNFEN